jgi:hypothetical protein
MVSMNEDSVVHPFGAEANGQARVVSARWGALPRLGSATIEVNGYAGGRRGAATGASRVRAVDMLGLDVQVPEAAGAAGAATAGLRGATSGALVAIVSRNASKYKD